MRLRPKGTLLLAGWHLWVKGHKPHTSQLTMTLATDRSSLFPYCCVHLQQDAPCTHTCVTAG